MPIFLYYLFAVKHLETSSGVVQCSKILIIMHFVEGREERNTRMLRQFIICKQTSILSSLPLPILYLFFDIYMMHKTSETGAQNSALFLLDYLHEIYFFNFETFEAGVYGVGERSYSVAMITGRYCTAVNCRGGVSCE